MALVRSGSSHWNAGFKVMMTGEGGRIKVPKDTDILAPGTCGYVVSLSSTERDIKERVVKVSEETYSEPNTNTHVL